MIKNLLLLAGVHMYSTVAGGVIARYVLIIGKTGRGKSNYVTREVKKKKKNGRGGYRV